MAPTKKEAATKSIVPALQKQTTPTLERVQQLVITDEKSKSEAATVLSDLKAVLKKVVDYKEAKTKPLNAALKIIRDETRQIESNLTAAIESTRDKLNSYQTEQKRIADKKAEDIAARVAPGRGNLTPETATKKIGELDKPSTSVDTGNGGAIKFRTVQKLVITDRTTLLLWLTNNFPDLLDFSERAVLDKAKAGIPVLGVHIETVQEAASY